MNNLISFGGNISQQINFAMQQNYVPVLRSVTLTNVSGSELTNVKLRISFEPEFAFDLESGSFDLKPDEPAEISPVNAALSTDFLFSLTEKIAGYIRLEAVQTDFEGNETVIARELRNVELLAFDQWSGVGFMPETLAAFVMPNHPAVQSVISKAGAYLQKWCGDPSFTDYQSRNVNTVRQQMGAIYAALQEENIAYATAPASFEQAQRVRTHDSVLDNKAGTCIDLAVLYCACLEAVGLNPLLVLTEGHAFAACWLENQTFPDCLEYDASALTKRAGTGALTFVECTDFTAGRAVDFNTAEKHGAENLRDPSKFCFALDLERTRSGGIRPMPARILKDGVYTAADYGERKKSEITSAPTDIIVTDYVAQTEHREVTKQVMWERKLLDLSLRNSLLNFRPTAANVQVMTDDLGTLEDIMAAGEAFKVMPIPNDVTLEMSDSRIYETENRRDLIKDIAHREFESRRLRTFMKETDLEKTMTRLHRLAKVSIEENGANTIYLALGLLRWYETDKSEKARYAPLVLIPIDIIKKVQDKSYSIRVRDEDTQVNITLLEMLRQFFGIDVQGLDPIPLDQSGIDLPLVFSTIRRAVMSKSRWDIEDCAFIGQFSFTRFIMWNDIRNRADELAKNKVVASLISGKTEWEGEDIAMSPLDLDEKIHPADVAVPVQADSSQLAAVVASGEGKSFVLHGPPGTGKSQTITNMIANALYNGKSVLFVAEKMAALSVVEKRLDKIGIGPFCLELHSNKAQKRAVLNQLEETLNVGKIKKAEEYRAEADKLYALRKELNTVMEEIHKKRSSGFSVYDAAVKYEQNRAFEGRLEFTAAQVNAMDGSTYKQWVECIESLVNVGARFGEAGELSLCRLTQADPALRQQMENDLRALQTELEKFTANAPAGEGFAGIRPASYAQTAALAELIKASLGDGAVLPALVTADGAAMDTSKGIVNDISALAQSRQQAESTFEKTVYGLNAADLMVRWKTAQGKWFLPKSLESKKIVKLLAAHAKAPGSINKENALDNLQMLSNIKESEDKLNSLPPAQTAPFGSLWNGANTDPNELGKAISLADSLRAKLDALNLDLSARQNVLRSIAANRGVDPGAAQGYCQSFESLSAAVDNAVRKYALVKDSLFAGENWPEAASAKCDGLINGLPRLREWTVIVGFANKLSALGAENVAETYFGGNVAVSELMPAFECALGKAVVSAALSGSRALSGFEGTLFEDTVRRLSETQDKFRKLTMQELAAKLSANVPAPGESAKSSELGILQRAIKSGGRMLSIRKLFDSIPNLLRKMCPVMLMSPISVAQYIDPSYPKFDLVIFDEASQLPTCEAVGAIARGENVIVVGDPKQMPPTSFFAANTVDEENYEKEDLESVLDDCLALSMPQKHLLWHYRSRHESLIAYSNSKYYENKLYTFPSPDDMISEVSWVHVEGFYDKGSTKTNRAEAQAIVDEISRRLRDPELRKQSIGVVTFSLPQQNLVDDLLGDAFRAEPELEVIANEMYEPILIKNLENVQGDERDVIFFSIGYGPDKDGKVSMNFGPLNRDGGWRRLNVAISRARCKMVVYSVISPEQIDLNRTRSEGVEGLKGFLDFAAKGRQALPVRAGSGSAGAGFEKVVAEELTKKGYSVKCSVGCSDYKIDVAVANPDKPDTYLLGISCCSENYYRNGTAYDRTLSQPGVLKGLGWNTADVYILDWLDNKERCLEKLEAEIQSALENYRHPKKAEEPEKKESKPVFETLEREPDKGILDMCDEYVPFKIKSYGTADKFEQAHMDKIKACINDCIAAEAPISKKLLEKKVFKCFGITRAGAVMKKTLEAALEASSCKCVKIGESEFMWPKDADPDAYGKCRARLDPKYSEDKRSFDEIAPEEIAAGIVLIMSRQIAMQRDDLLRETAHLFGFTRMSDTIDTAVSLGIRAAKLRGKIAFGDDGRITYCG